MKVRTIFEKIFRTYDLVNHIITFGLDVFWRRIAATYCTHDGVVVDLCCGTGKFLSSLSKSSRENTFLIGIDFTEKMLRKAKEKVGFKKIDFIVASATNLPLRNGCVNCIGMSFSFRNLIYKNILAKPSLSEILRVLSLKGRFVSLETSQAIIYPLRKFLNLYLIKIVPFIGGLISKHESAYRYLGISAIYFPSAEQLSEMLGEIGFNRVSFKRILFGIVTIHICKK